VETVPECTCGDGYTGGDCNTCEVNPWLADDDEDEEEEEDEEDDWRVLPMLWMPSHACLGGRGGGGSQTSTTVARTERGAAAPCCFRQGYFNIECENKYVVLSAVVGVLFVCSLLVIDTKRLMGAPAVKWVET
jgi:hypothetical protein